jgi:glutathione peroxidase-family protein
MKISIIISVILAVSFKIAAQNTQGISNIKFTTINNIDVDMKNYQRMKIIVVTLDASNINSSYMLSLDTFYRKVIQKAVVIAVPVNDFGIPVEPSNLVRLIDSLHISYPVTMISKGKRGPGQHPLMTWITTTSTKNHFNMDLQRPGQMFLVSTTGVLYGELQAFAPLNEKMVSDGMSNEVTE